ncbi:flagellar hook-length control protein FliK [Halorhodospira halochloris]|uniref:Flagellar hook-length control protein FliK n=1 Tax=Halorhodospira halochloris TaxID=1052 RepID=A0A0X8X9M8_HALHR|nr:WD40 repeat domain-containing protein [Halorhodospira halochloris]MBK1652617.1 hypothetical protein [Halorhodospira halochloris]BAU57934.1 flagellar hook-length control protein FliK [Halorhodospira halochloris]
MANDELWYKDEGFWFNGEAHDDSVRDLALGHEILYSASDDGTVGFFDRETGEHLGSWEYGSELDKIRAVEVTEGYVYMAGTTGNIYRAEKPTDLEDIQQPDDDEFIEFEPNYDQYGVHDLAIDYDDPELYAVGYDGSVRAYSTDLEKEWKKEDVHDHSDSGDGDGRGVVSVELSDDGGTVFSAGHNGRTIVAQDAENGEENWTVSLDDVDDDTPGDIVDMALAGDVLSVISSKGKYYEFDTNDEPEEPIYEYQYHTDFEIRSVDAIPAPWSPEDWGDEYEEISSSLHFVGAGPVLLEGGEGSLELYMGHIGDDHPHPYEDEYMYPIMLNTYYWDPDDFDPDDFDPEDIDDSPDLQQDPAEFKITQGPELDPETVEWGDSFDITSKVKNSGEMVGDQEVSVSVSGKEVYAKELELDGGESSEISTTVETDEWDWLIEPGDYEVAINTEDDSATSDLTLEAPSDFYRVSDEDDLRQALADEDGLAEDTLEIWIDGEISVSESLTYDLDVDLKIEAVGSEAALSGDGDGRLLDVTGAPEKVEIDGVDLRDGNAEHGGGGAIRAGSTEELHLSDMELNGNEAMAGYGGAVQARSVIAEQVYFNDNEAVAGGAIHQNGWSNQSLELHEVVFEGNEAITRGGAIKTRRADLDLDRAAVNSGNEAGIAGDALYTRLGDHTGDIEGDSIGDSAGKEWGTADVEIDFELADEYSVDFGETKEVTVATLENDDGEFLGSRNIELEINGEKKLFERGWVDVEDSETISFDVDTEELALQPSVYDITLRTPDGTKDDQAELIVVPGDDFSLDGETFYLFGEEDISIGEVFGALIFDEGSKLDASDLSGDLDLWIDRENSDDGEYEIQLGQGQNEVYLENNEDGGAKFDFWFADAQSTDNVIHGFTSEDVLHFASIDGIDPRQFEEYENDDWDWVIQDDEGNNQIGIKEEDADIVFEVAGDGEGTYDSDDVIVTLKDASEEWDGGIFSDNIIALMGDNGEAITAYDAQEVNGKGWDSLTGFGEIEMDDDDNNNTLKINELNPDFTATIHSPDETLVGLIAGSVETDATNLDLSGKDSDIDGPITFDFSKHTENFQLSFMFDEENDNHYEDIRVKGFDHGNDDSVFEFHIDVDTDLPIMAEDARVENENEDWLVVSTNNFASEEDLAIRLESVGDKGGNAVLDLESMFTFDKDWGDVIGDGGDVEEDKVDEVSAKSGEIELVDVDATDITSDDFFSPIVDYDGILTASQVNEFGWGNITDADGIMMDDGDNDTLEIDEFNYAWGGAEISDSMDHNNTVALISTSLEGDRTDLHFTGNDSEIGDSDSITFDFRDYTEEGFFCLDFVGYGNNDYFEDMIIHGFEEDNYNSILDFTALEENQYSPPDQEDIDFDEIDSVGTVNDDEGQDWLVQYDASDGGQWLAIAIDGDELDLTNATVGSDDGNLTDNLSDLEEVDMSKGEEGGVGDPVGAPNSGSIKLVEVGYENLTEDDFILYT